MLPGKLVSLARYVKFETAADEIEEPEMLVPVMLVQEKVSRASSREVKSLVPMRGVIGVIEAVEGIANRLVAMLEVVVMREVIAIRHVIFREKLAIATRLVMLSKYGESGYLESGALGIGVRGKAARIEVIHYAANLHAANLHAANLSAANLSVVAIREDAQKVDRLIVDRRVKVAVRNNAVVSLGRRYRVSLSHVRLMIDLSRTS